MNQFAPQSKPPEAESVRMVRSERANGWEIHRELFATLELCRLAV